RLMLLETVNLYDIANRPHYDVRMPRLFSYGTLQKPDVQLATFGRLLNGHQDDIIGFEQGIFRVVDPAFVAKSGKADHAIVRFNGRDESRVRGMVLELTDSELAQADL